MDLQNNIIGLKASATLAINELSQKLITEGKEVFKFGLGQSPFPVPDIIVKEIMARITISNILFVFFSIIYLKNMKVNSYSYYNNYYSYYCSPQTTFLFQKRAKF